MTPKEALFVAGGLFAIMFLLLIAAIVGAANFGVVGVVIAGGTYLIGFISMGTAQGVFLWFCGAGAVIGLLQGIAAILDA